MTPKLNILRYDDKCNDKTLFIFLMLTSATVDGSILQSFYNLKYKILRATT